MFLSKASFLKDISTAMPLAFSVVSRYSRVSLIALYFSPKGTKWIKKIKFFFSLVPLDHSIISYLIWSGKSHGRHDIRCLFGANKISSKSINDNKISSGWVKEKRLMVFVSHECMTDVPSFVKWKADRVERSGKTLRLSSDDMQVSKCIIYCKL